MEYNINIFIDNKEFQSMLIDGWYTHATQIKSPNFSSRSNKMKISLVVMHCISLPEGVYDNSNIENLFTNSLNCNLDNTFQSLVGVEVSAHFCIKRNGEVIQFVSVDDKAWHAGVSSYNGVSSCNDFSIGIEMQGTDSSTYEELQYVSLNKLLLEIRKYCPKVCDIASHSDIAPGRKTDPGKCFDWTKVDFIVCS